MPEPAGLRVSCPACDQPATLKTITHDVEWFGTLIFNTLDCPHCHYKWNDVMPANLDGSPTHYEIHLTSEKDLSVKVLKSSTTTIHVPELGVEIEPGPASDGYITNAEGLLDRVQAILGQLLRGSETESEKKEATNRMEKLLSFREGKKPFTIEVLDPYGNGRLVGNKVKKRPLTEKEVNELKKPIPIMDSVR